MNFVVYVNHPNNKAIIHSTDCGKYLSRKRNKTHNGYWTEPLASLEIAVNYAKSTGKKIIDTCAFCSIPLK